MVVYGEFYQPGLGKLGSGSFDFSAKRLKRQVARTVTLHTRSGRSLCGQYGVYRQHRRQLPR
jgi:hypothetical protein